MRAAVWLDFRGGAAWEIVPEVIPRGSRDRFSTLEASAKLSIGLSQRSKHLALALEVGAAVGILNFVGRGTLPSAAAVHAGAAAGDRDTAFCMRASSLASLRGVTARIQTSQCPTNDKQTRGRLQPKNKFFAGHLLLRS